MIDDSAPYRVLKIGELTRLIASQLILIGRESAANLACTCRYLEVPVLSTLWETQSPLYTLLKTLPRDARGWEYLRPGKRVVRDLNLPLHLGCRRMKGDTDERFRQACQCLAQFSFQMSWASILKSLEFVSRDQIFDNGSVPFHTVVP